MRMLANIFIMVMTAVLSTLTMASVASEVQNTNPQTTKLQTQPANQQQPATTLSAQTQPANQQQPTKLSAQPQALNQPAEPQPPEMVLLPGSHILAGNPDKNEFFIVGEGQPTPPALIEAQKQAEDHVKPIQVAIDEAKKTIEEMKLPKLEKALGENTHKIDAQVQATNVVQAALKTSPETAQAENDVNPQLGNMMAAPVISDATSAPVPGTETPKTVETEAPIKADVKADKKTTKTVTPTKKKTAKPLPPVKTSAVDKKTLIKHVFNTKEHETKRPVVTNKKSIVATKVTKQPVTKKALAKVKQNVKPKAVHAMTAKQKSINVKALLAKVEVIKPDLKSVAKKPKAKTVTSLTKLPKTKTVTSSTQQAESSVSATETNQPAAVGKTVSELKYSHSVFEGASLAVA